MENHKKHVEQMIVETILHEFEEQRIKEENLPEIASFVLSKIDNIRTHPELVNFTAELAQKWPFFTNIATIEKAEEKKVLEYHASKQVLSLIQSGKSQEAINLARQSTK